MADLSQRRRRGNVRAIFAIVALVSSSGLGWSESAKGSPATPWVEEFKRTKVDWEQLEVAKKMVALRDPGILPQLAGGLTQEDRRLRGNVAFVFASLGDERGFAVLQAILMDRSTRPEGQGIPGGSYSLERQIGADRYYAAHLLGDLKDARAVPILVPLLRDKEVNAIVPWSLGEIGDPRAVPPLIETLGDRDPSMRVLAIFALERLRAKEALPRLRELLGDQEKCNFDQFVSVAEAAREAIGKLEAKSVP